MIYLNKKFSIPALKIKFNKTPLAINQINRNFKFQNIFHKKKNDVIFLKNIFSTFTFQRSLFG